MKLDNVIAERSTKTIYRDGEHVIKVFNENYSKADILNEALNLARVEETGLSIPAVEEVLKIDGKWALVTQFLEGKTVADCVKENPSKLVEYMERFVEIQMEIHSKKAPLLTKLKDKMNRKISESALDATVRYEMHTRLESMPRHRKLCHGDFNASNVLLRDDGTFSVLDWSHATQGNGSADVARTYLMLCLKGTTEMAEQYLNMYCKKTDTAKQYVQKWFPIVAATQSVKGNPEEKEFLMKWVNVVEYE